MVPSITNFLTAARGVPVWQFLLEVLLIGIVVFWVIRFLQGTRGVRVLKGIVVLLITLYLGVRILGGFFDLARLDILFGRFLFYASFAAIVVFQPELRRALMRLGETRLLRGSTAAEDEVEELVKACGILARRRVGALVALERDDGLAGYAEDATRIDAEVTSQLLTTIFHPNTALHDLGVVLRDGRLAFAGVQFPLAESGDLPKELGSRHRAAVGLSLDTDAIVVAVSEETGDISVAERGRLHRKIPVDRLADTLRELLNRSVATGGSRASGLVVDAGQPPLTALERRTEKPGDRAAEKPRPAASKPAAEPAKASPEIRETKPIGGNADTMSGAPSPRPAPQQKAATT